MVLMVLANTLRPVRLMDFPTGVRLRLLLARPSWLFTRRLPRRAPAPAVTPPPIATFLPVSSISLLPVRLPWTYLDSPTSALPAPTAPVDFAHCLLDLPCTILATWPPTPRPATPAPPISSPFCTSCLSQCRIYRTWHRCGNRRGRPLEIEGGNGVADQALIEPLTDFLARPIRTRARRLPTFIERLGFM